MGAIKGKKQRWHYKTGKGKLIYDKLQEDILTHGEWAQNYFQLSRETGVPDQTLHTWKDRIIKERGPIDVTKAGVAIVNALKANIAMCQKELKDPDNTKTDRAGIRRSLNDMIKTYTETVEKYGHKETIAKKIKVEGGLWEELATIYKDKDGDK